MGESYKIPTQTHIGHVHLKVSNLTESLKFYQDILGFDITARFGEQAAFLSAGGYHHHIALNTWESKYAPRPPRFTTGLYHVAILYPTRKDLANIYRRLVKINYPILGASDHGISEAIYLEDPDGNGIELYRDKEKSEWPSNEDGSVNLSVSQRLDLTALLQET